MTKSKSYQRYSSSFKKMALTKAAEEGMTDARTCDELGVSDRQLRRCSSLFLLSVNNRA